MKIKENPADNIMSLTNFLKQTDSLTAKYTAEQDVQVKRNQCSVSTIDSTYEAIRKNFETIETGEVSISSEYNEEYDDWYGGEEFFYEDPEDIGGMLQTACDFIHTCRDIEEYEKGLDN